MTFPESQDDSGKNSNNLSKCSFQYHKAEKWALTLRKGPFPSFMMNFSYHCECLLQISVEAAGTRNRIPRQVYLWCWNALAVAFVQSRDLTGVSGNGSQNHSTQYQKAMKEVLT